MLCVTLSLPARATVLFGVSQLPQTGPVRGWSPSGALECCAGEKGGRGVSHELSTMMWSSTQSRTPPLVTTRNSQLPGAGAVNVPSNRAVKSSSEGRCAALPSHAMEAASGYLRDRAGITPLQLFELGDDGASMEFEYHAARSPVRSPVATVTHVARTRTSARDAKATMSEKEGERERM